MPSTPCHAGIPTGIPRRTSARTPTWQPKRSLHVSSEGTFLAPHYTSGTKVRQTFRNYPRPAERQSEVGFPLQAKARPGEDGVEERLSKECAAECAAD